jgi:hypothetical protein
MSGLHSAPTVVGLRSLGLLAASASPLSGLWTSRHFHCRLLQVARPSSSSVVVFVMSLDLPPAPSSPSSKSKPLCGSIVAFASGRPPQRLRSFGSKLLQICILCSGGRLHAHDMVGILLYDFIAQQCSVLASYSLMMLFIARDKTRLWPDELRHWTKLSFSGWQEDLRPLLTRDPAVYGEISLTLCQRALCLATSTNDD